jgi:acyl-CoA thioesterase
MSEFDSDTAVSPGAEPGRFTAQVTPRWNVGPVPNGGYVMSIALRALAASLPGRDPITLTAHFVRAARPGPLDLAVETVKLGKTIATAEARLTQAGGEITRVLASFGALDPGAGARFVDGAPPVLPPPEAIEVRRPAPIEVAQRFDTRFDPESLRFTEPGAPPQTRAELRAWNRFVDGREPDVLSLPLFADALMPPVFAVIQPGWVPTLSLTVHIRARPAPGWLRCVFRTRFLFGGLLEEDGELWDSTGQLVALSRQLAAVPTRSYT